MPPPTLTSFLTHIQSFSHHKLNKQGQARHDLLHTCFTPAPDAHSCTPCFSTNTAGNTHLTLTTTVWPKVLFKQDFVSQPRQDAKMHWDFLTFSVPHSSSCSIFLLLFFPSIVFANSTQKQTPSLTVVELGSFRVWVCGKLDTCFSIQRIRQVLHRSMCEHSSWYISNSISPSGFTSDRLSAAVCCMCEEATLENVWTIRLMCENGYRNSTTN